VGHLSRKHSAGERHWHRAGLLSAKHVWHRAVMAAGVSASFPRALEARAGIVRVIASRAERFMQIQ